MCQHQPVIAFSNAPYRIPFCNFASASAFETQHNPDQDYIGVWAREPFDRLKIRETATANENEFFGTVSISQMPLPTTVFNDRFESAP